jgi:signal transduction histidine kinase
MASHEFRTPLATILAASDLLKRFNHKLSEEKKQNHLNKIQTEVRNMTRLLEDVLIIGKAEAKKIDFHPLPLDLNQFCQDILEEIEMATAATHIIKFQIEGDCQNANIDQKLLRQILVNLLSNAVKYSPANSTVIFKVIHQLEKIIFKIQDQGIGIPVKDKPHLFNPFHRASNAINIPGTGLGLAIVNNAVELHGGTIEVESEVGLGTTFTVCLPVGLISDENNSGY